MFARTTPEAGSAIKEANFFFVSLVTWLLSLFKKTTENKAGIKKPDHVKKEDFGITDKTVRKCDNR